MKKIAALAVLSTLTACMQYQPVDTPPVSVNFSSKVAQANVAEYKEVEFRTLMEVAGKSAEVKGVPCTVTGTGFSAKIITPAKVNMPTYLGKTEDASVSCKTNTAAGTKDVPAINVTLENMKANSGSGGLLGLVVSSVAVGVMKSTRNPAKDQFRYPTRIEVKLDGTAQ